MMCQESMTAKLSAERPVAPRPTKEQVQALRAKRRILMQSAESGEIVYAIYQGGGQPGTRRELGPLKMVTRNTVLAWCLLTGQLKSYRLEALEILPEDRSAPAYLTYFDDDVQ